MNLISVDEVTVVLPTDHPSHGHKRLGMEIDKWIAKEKGLKEKQ